MHGEKDILFGLSSFRLHRIPYQVLMLCPPIPPLWDNVRDPLLPKHPVMHEILGSPLNVLVTNRKTAEPQRMSARTSWNPVYPLGRLWTPSLASKLARRFSRC